MNWFVAIALLMPSFASAFSLETLPAYQDLVLSDRLGQLSQKSKEIELSCVRDRSVRAQIETSHPKWSTWPSEMAARNAGAIRRESLGRLKQTRTHLLSARACAIKQDPKTDLVEQLSPRKQLPGQILFQTATAKTIMSALRPHCFQSLRRGLAGFYENHACFGGDIAMNADLERAFGASKPSMVANAAELLARAALDATPGSRLDILSTLSDLSPGLSNRDAMALLAATGTSGNSGMTGWMQSLEDRWLIEGLLSNLPLKAVYQNTMLLQSAKANYIGLREIVDSKKLMLTLGTRLINRWNRHNLMAAYLACHFSHLPKTDVTSVIAKIGVGYESKDFVSHLVSGVSLKTSIENFNQDTERYRSAGAAGYELCRARSL